MAQEQPPITPPLELVDQWICALEYQPDAEVFSQAARWGADQELEACVNWLLLNGWGQAIDRLRAARRPSEQPPTADELIKLARAMRDIAGHEGRWMDELERVAQLMEQQSRALEALPDD